MALAEDNDSLRRLARSVMLGELARDEYRRQRAALVDRHAGEAPVPTSPGVVAQARPAVPAASLDDTHPTLPAVPAAAASAPAQADGVAAKSGSHGDLWIGVVAVVLVLLIVGGLLAYFWR